MASSVTPSAKIDWTSAEVRGGDLSLPLEGRLSGAWTTHLAGLVDRLPPQRGLQTIAVGPAHITVSGIRRGGAPDVHDLLEHLVAETNAAFARYDASASESPAAARRRRARSAWASLLLMVLAGAAVALQWADWEAPVRAVVVLAFIVFAPGSAILRVWDLAGGWAGLGLGIALSLSLAMVVASATAYAGVWSPLGALCGLAGLTILAAGVSLIRVRGRAPATSTALVSP